MNNKPQSTFDRKLEKILEEVDFKDKNEKMLTKEVVRNCVSPPTGTCSLVNENSLGLPGDEYVTWFAQLCRDLFLRLETRNLVGIQPMKGPVGTTLHLSYTKKGTFIPTSYATEASTYQFNIAWNTNIGTLTRHISEIPSDTKKSIVHELAHKFTAEHINLISEEASKNEVIKIPDINSVKHAVNDLIFVIEHSTKRGKANWMVIGEGNEIARERLTKPVEAPMERHGVFNGLDLFVADKTLISSDTVIIGYKGKASEIDVGLVLAPYVLLIPKLDMSTKFLTRYGISRSEDGHKCYRKIIIES